MKLRRNRNVWPVWAVSLPAFLTLAAHAYGQTYYVNAVTGNDNNTGLSPSSPWQSLTKVDDTNFAPGSNILFQAGDNWYGSLNATSSGTSTAPITYGSYGTGANPTFWGSDPVSASAFQPVANEPDTYFYPTTTTVNSFLVNHQFTDSAAMLTQSSSDPTNISYVQSTANSWYYDADASTPGLYVNTGTPVSASNVYTVATRQNVVNTNYQSNLVFENLSVAESAANNGGYAFLAMGGSNITFENSTAVAAGKHAFAAIDTNNFVGKGLQASYLMPDQGYGGATGFVSYADYNVSNTTAAWINDTFTNPNGAYEGFITHVTSSDANPTPLANVLVQNLTTVNGIGMAIFTSGNEVVNVQGGTIVNGALLIYGNNVMLNKMLITGPNAEVDLTGSNNTLQNSVIVGGTPNWQGGHNGMVVDGSYSTVNGVNVEFGGNNIIRYNTIVVSPTASYAAAAIGLLNQNSTSQFYGNIIQTPSGAIFVLDPQGKQSAQFSNNLFSIDPNSGYSAPLVIDNAFDFTPLPLWTNGTNLQAIYADPMFTNAAGGDYTLLPGSPALGVFDPTTNQYVPYDFYGNSRPASMTDLGAIEAPLDGDANLDGTVDITDLGILLSNWQKTGMDWQQGDFNGDGTVNSTDLGLLLANWQDSVTMSPAELEALESLTGDSIVANPDGVGFQLVSVPEPSGLALIGLAPLLMSRRRRQGRRGLARV